MKTSSEKSGSILIIAMVILVAFSLMTVALLQLGGFSEKETIKQLRHEQARWAAEAGLEKALSLIMASGNYRLALDQNEPDGTLVTSTYTADYDVTITESNISSTVTAYTIISTGTVTNQGVEGRATVQMVAETAPGGQQALLALGGNSKISSNVDIDGTIYQEPPGTLDVSSNVHITDLVDAEGGITGGGAGSVTPGDLPDPEPGPKVDRTEYIAQYDYASNTNNSNVTQGNYTGSVELNSDTVYYNGNITITKFEGSGDGTVVATGTITIDSNTDLPAGASLVAGENILFKNQSTFGGENEIFTFKSITVDSGSEFNGIGVSLLAADGVKVSANLDGFQGIIYGDGLYFDPAKDGKYYSVILTPGGQSEMRGTIIAWEGFYIGSNADITYDPTVFADPNPVDNLDAITLIRGSWKLLRE